jgi:hypothetical protein
MAAPNLNSNAAIYGNTATLSVANTTENTLLTNAASSGKAQRLRSVTANNNSTTLSVDVTLRLYSAASGGTVLAQIGPVTVPAYAAVIVVGEENKLWLVEDRRITVQASASNQVSILAPYEEVG